MAGRPREFKEEYIRQALIAYQEGFTDVKFCKLINISRDSLNRWRREYPEFGKAVQQGKDEYDSERVEKALRKRALGYSVNETTREVLIVGKGNERTIVDDKLRVTKRTRKHISSDPTCMIFWLKNRNRARWKDIKAIEASGPDGGAIPIDLTSLLKDLTTDELRILKDIAAKAATAGNS